LSQGQAPSSSDGAYFFAPIGSIEHALFCEKSDITGTTSGSSGVKKRAEQQSGAIEDLGPGQFG
jgi:hypothetical protein